MKVRVRGRDGGLVVYLINARDLEQHRRNHPELEIIPEPPVTPLPLDTPTARMIERTAKEKERERRAKEPHKALGQMNFDGFAMLQRRRGEDHETSE